MEFMNRVELAQENQNIIETTDSIIKHFVPKGLGEAGYFTYKGVIVCPIGKTPDVEHRLNMTLEQMMHSKIK